LNPKRGRTRLIVGRRKKKMKFEHGRKRSRNLATNLPSPSHTGAAVATTNVTPICSPKRGATKDTGYTTPIG
jgi:hypothetical protein